MGVNYMPFLGTIINFISVFVIGLLGAFEKKGIPKRISEAVISGMALCVIYIGIDGVMETAPAVSEGSFFSAGLTKALIMIISVALGTVIGEIVDFDKLILKLGDFVETRIDRIAYKSHPEDGTRGNFSRGFVSCSLLFCVGAMAVNGSIMDGLGSPDILLAKTVIDSITVFIMATTLGAGCAFSAFFLLAFQGSIAVLSFFLASFIPASAVTYMSATGSLIIILVGTNVLGVTNVKTANMVPAIFMPLLLDPLFKLIAG